MQEYTNKLYDFEVNPKKYDLTNPKINEDLWNAKYGLNSAINSETKKVIPIPARMCAFVPMNVPIAFGLIVLPATTFNIVTFNLINQTYNAMMNYANGSGTEDSIKYTSISYSLAVFSSITSGVLLKRMFNKKASIGIIQEGVIRVLPSGIAGFLNLFFMRSDYFTKGISIRDEKDNILGFSKKCGIKAVFEGGASRFILPLPLLANHFFVKSVSKMKLPKKLSVFIELLSCSVALGIGLPLSIALFKQKGMIKTSLLEEEFRNKPEFKDLEFVYYNKGL